MLPMETIHVRLRTLSVKVFIMSQFPALCLHCLFCCQNPYLQVLRKQDLRKILLYIIKL